MRIKESLSRRVYLVCNYIFVGVLAVVCIYPMLHVLAISLSSTHAVNAGEVNLLPVGFQLDAYKFVTQSKEFYTSFGVSVRRTLLGVVVNMTLTVLAGYPLSKSKAKFYARNRYMWYFVITMLFGGGLIPAYLSVRFTGLIDTIWALILPCAVPVYNVILFQNFVKALPKEILESAYMDGAGEWTVLLRMVLPLSKPVLATLTLFVAVGHWNAWFDGMFYMNSTTNYPMATYLATQILNSNKNLTNMTPEQLAALVSLNEKTMRSAQLFLSIVPILLVYPFLQRFFVKGVMVGAVKG